MLLFNYAIIIQLDNWSNLKTHEQGTHVQYMEWHFYVWCFKYRTIWGWLNSRVETYGGLKYVNTLSKGCHLDVVRGPSTPHDPESDAGGSLSSWQGHPSR
jgi:hypothetical protein